MEYISPRVVKQQENRAVYPANKREDAEPGDKNSNHFGCGAPLYRLRNSI